MTRSFALLALILAWVSGPRDLVASSDLTTQNCSNKFIELGEDVDQLRWFWPGGLTTDFYGSVLYKDGRTAELEGNRHFLCDLKITRRSEAKNILTADELGIDMKMFSVSQDWQFDDTSGDAELGDKSVNTWSNFLSKRSWMYDHDVVGRGYHLSRFAVQTVDGQLRYVDLPANRVFLNRRSVDFRVAHGSKKRTTTAYALTEADLERGPALAVYGYYEGRLRLLARTPWHGDPKGWINPVYGGDIDRDGCAEVAVIRDPQKDGLLEIWRMRPERSPDGTPYTLVKQSSADGFSNHIFGTAAERISTAADIDGNLRMELIVPNLQRTALRIMSFKDGELSERQRIDLPVPVAHAMIYYSKPGLQREFAVVVPFEDGTVRSLPIEMEFQEAEKPRNECLSRSKPN